jgi:hypothetical protein
LTRPGRKAVRRSPGTVLLPLILAAAGCAGCGPRLGQVSGTVRYKEEVLPGKGVTWTVVFVCPDGRRGTASVGPDGTYTAEGVPAGPVKIAVVGAPRVAAPVPDPGQPPPRLDPATHRLLSRLQKYKDPDRSGLTYTVKEGKQRHDVVLNP